MRRAAAMVAACRVHIAANAPSGTYRVVASGTIAHGRDWTSGPTLTAQGTVTVVGPAPTPVEPPPVTHQCQRCVCEQCR